jgi:hypothetical protein
MPDIDPTLRPPDGWAQDPLSAFIETARQNTFATFVKMRGAFDRLRDIDRLFVRATENLHGFQGEDDLLPAALLLRAHGAYRGACRFALSGQSAEAYPVLRACLEDSLYAFFLRTYPTKAETWLRRSDDAASKRKVKDEFKVTPMLALLEEADAATGRAVRTLYDQTVDFGAHPNELMLTSNSRMETTGDTHQLAVAYLAGGTPAMAVCLKTTAQVGVASLRTFRLIFRARFDLLDISAALEPVSRGL